MFHVKHLKENVYEQENRFMWKRKMESVSKRIYRAEMFHVKYLRENAPEKENGLRISTNRKYWWEEKLFHVKHLRKDAEVS